MENTAEETKDRLKASELLAKTKGMFVERHEVKAEVMRVTGFEVVADE